MSKAGGETSTSAIQTRMVNVSATQLSLRRQDAVIVCYSGARRPPLPGSLAQGRQQGRMKRLRLFVLRPVPCIVDQRM